LARAVRFGIYEADLGTGELRKNGFKVSLQEQPFQVLAMLLAHPGELVTREELQKQAWPDDTFVDFDLGLNTTIKKIREALGDSARNPRFVETLPKRGYRFIAAVEEINRNSVTVPVSSADTGQERLEHRGGPGAESKAATGFSAAKEEGRESVARKPHRQIWLVLAVLVAAASVLSWRQFRPTAHHDAAVTFSLKGLSYLNDAYDMPDKNQRAIDSLEQAVKLDRSYAPAYAGLGEAYFAQFAATREEPWIEKAESACKESVRLDGVLPAAFNCLGTVHAGRGLYEDAVAEFSQAIKLDPENAASFRGRATAYRGRNKENDIPAAEADYLRAIALAPNDWRDYLFLASFYHRLGRDCDSVAAFKRAIALRPDNSEAIARLGALYIEMGQYDEAISALAEALRLSPGFAAYENLGSAYLDRHDFAKAVENFKSALDRNSQDKGPDDYRAHGNLARAYWWAGQRELAREEYERAVRLAGEQLQINPKDADAHLSLAIFYAMLGQGDDSRNDLDLALSLQPKSPETKFWAMIIALQLGNKEKALAWLPEALRYSTAEVRAAPELNSLRRDPEFQRELAKTVAHSPLSCKQNQTYTSKRSTL
jgi:tetratricopeptide (TPR) repeat protein/DNA-binding winged helix-turn-helix (wHTH) protein